jgi:hypothetical protein
LPSTYDLRPTTYDLRPTTSYHSACPPPSAVSRSLAHGRRTAPRTPSREPRGAWGSRHAASMCCDGPDSSGRWLAHSSKRSVQRFDPDFILCTWHAWGLGPERLQRLLRGRRSALWFFDAAPHEGTIELARLCDAMYLTYADQREQYRAAGVRTVRFLPQGLDPDQDRPVTRVRAADACESPSSGRGSIRTAGHSCRRSGAPRSCASGARDGMVPPPTCTSPADRWSAHASRKWWRHRRSHSGPTPSRHRMSPRPQPRTGCGRFSAWGGHTSDHGFRGIEAFAAHEEHCRWYRDADDCVVQLRELLADPAGRRAMAERGRAHALAHHGYDARLALLLADQEMPLPATTV